jgi:serine phosphatase RsbU (regulator of sigma subunit)
VYILAWGTKMKNIASKKRLTTAGLVTVLLLLALFSFGALLMIQKTDGQVSKADSITDLYQEARHQIFLEESELQTSIFEPDPASQHMFMNTYQQTLTALKNIEVADRADNAAIIQLLLTEQSRYLSLAKMFFSLLNIHQIAQAVLFHRTRIFPLFDTINQQIDRRTTLEQKSTIQNLAHQGAILRSVFVATFLAFLCGISLITLFLWMLRSYERQQRTMELHEQKLQYAAHMQLQSLPQKLPTIAGLEISAHSHPAQLAGGDFYSLDRHATGQYTLSIGDVSGKGMRAVLLMTMVRAVIHTEVNAYAQFTEPWYILHRTNKHLYTDFTEAGMFATIFACSYDPTTQLLTYANAGHSPVLYCPASGPAQLLRAEAPPVGVLTVLYPKSAMISFAPGDILVMATDGLCEAHNMQGELFGYARLMTLIESLRQKTAREIAGALFDAVKRFATGCDQYDDQTVIVVKGVAR